MSASCSPEFKKTKSFKVCRRLFDLVLATPWWRDMAIRFMRQGMSLSLQGRSSIHDLTPDELRRSVLTCFKLNRAWNQNRRASASFFRILSHKTIQLKGHHTFDYDGRVLKGVSERYLLYATKKAVILCLDLDELRNVGKQETPFDRIVASSTDLPSRMTFCVGIKFGMRRSIFRGPQHYE